MKKIIMLVAIASLVFGVVGFAMAADECSTCVAPGTINRACPSDQDQCTSVPFDYEDVDNDFYYILNNNEVYAPNYCESAGKTPRRALFPACDCENFKQDDTIDIRMEILVNGETGDNGAYWAECVESIDVGTYTSDTAACKDGHNYSGDFEGPFDYMYYNDEGTLVTGGDPCEYGMSAHCWTSDTSERDTRVTVIQPDPDAPAYAHGYVITQDDDSQNKSIWAIDIPWMRFDLNKVSSGDVISVKICLAKADEDGLVDLGGICGDTGCCCEFIVGTLGCCADQVTTSDHLVYPYATPMNSADWWYGMVINNLSSTDGTATITVYETDGDTASVDVPITANNMYVTNNQALMTAFGGSIGDARAFFTVSTDFNADGFMFIGNDMKAEAMGYLPSK